MMAEGCLFDWSGVYFKKVVEWSLLGLQLGYVAIYGVGWKGRFLNRPSDASIWKSNRDQFRRIVDFH